MFSIAAINDTDSRRQWEPLAPAKEAQEFHLSQTYHEGLVKLHAKEYEKARELLESVLRDPLISSAQVDNSASDNHLLQLRFLALKNLANTFLQQGSAHHENALQCYLQAVEIDGKDSVVWNQLGTLSCSMGLLSISRWAFEQGLLCSPSNWNCMEKLLEVLIAIGDEVACLSVAKMILRHWPSHSRALHVKNVIEESEIVPFAPRGIDRLEPKHVRLKFPDKRKATDEFADDAPLKRAKTKVELLLPETSWCALAGSLLSILAPMSNCASDMTEKDLRSGDIQLDIKLPSSSENPILALEDGGLSVYRVSEDLSQGDFSAERETVFKDKLVASSEEQPQERRSTRLERLRSRKPGKEESDYTTTKDQAAVIKFLEPFIASAFGGDRESDEAARDCSKCHGQTNSSEAECSLIAKFVRESSGNLGAYHVSHLLLQEAARRRLTYRDGYIRFLDLDKLTRDWRQERTPECSLFLAELYYDFGLTSDDASKLSDFLSESSYHLCKVIESVALEHHLSTSCAVNFESSSSLSNPEMINSFVNNESPFWVRFFWLSGRLSVMDNNKAKAHKEFSISLSILSKKNDEYDSFLVPMPHCKTIKELTLERVLYEINMLKVDFLMEKDSVEMMGKEMYMDCISLLAPLLFCTKDVYPDVSLLPVTAGRKSEKIASVELLALDLLIKAGEKTDPEDLELCLNCHQRKLQILIGAAGTGEFPVSQKLFVQQLGSTASEIELRGSSDKQWICLVAEEVKAISQCVSKVKNHIDQSGDLKGNIIPPKSIRDMQSLLLAAMCKIVSMLSNKKSAGSLPVDLNEQKQRSCFVSAAIAFCKLQHLDPSITIKTQVDLIVAMHDLLAEYGLCCAGEGVGEDEEGTYLKFAIKHLLALDMKLKSSVPSSNEDATQSNQQPSEDGHLESNSRTTDLEMVPAEAHAAENVVPGEDDSSSKIEEKDHMDVGCQKRVGGGHDRKDGVDNKSVECGGEMSEDEREELELQIDNALDQCLFCLYGLNLRSDSTYEDEIANHRNTSRGDYQTKEQCADVFQYILPYARGSSRTGLVKLRRVLRAIRKHFPQPPEDVLADSVIDKFLDDADLSEDKLSEEAGSDGFLHTMTKILFSTKGSIKQYKKSLVASSGPYMDVYCNLFFYMAQSEEMSATDKWTGFVLAKEGEEFVQQNANLFKYDLLYNPLRFESWQRLANIYDEEVDLLLNDGSKHINVAGWRKNASLPMRVETSRRRSRRCLIMSLALAKTPDQQSEIHELLALVYYDSLQNVVPFYDQRSNLPIKDAVWMRFCENSLKQFQKAFAKKEDWSHAFYMGKLSEKLEYSHEMSLSYYNKAISLNPSAVDSVYRMHASRLKLLCKYGKEDLKVLKVVSGYCFSQTVKAAVAEILCKIGCEVSPASMDLKEMIAQKNLEGRCEKSKQLEEVWEMLYTDCLSALETCVEGDLKHFHKARYMLAQGFYKRAQKGDLERAKDELSFCFKSSRSSFTINMWEIDGMVKKGRRKTPGVAANKKVLEVHLPESSRKFITCIRKYLLFYLKLLEEAKDIHTLDKALISIRADKRFSLCIEDLVPIALGRYIKALVASMLQPRSGAGTNSEHILEKLFALFMDQGYLFADVCSLPDMKCSGISESSLYGCLHQHICNLERNGKLETIEAINEKVRKRFKNPKLSNSSCAKVCRHASVSWCRSLIISLALITPLQSEQSVEAQNHNASENASENAQRLLYVDLQTDEFWNSSFEDSTQLKQVETKWIPVLNKIKNTAIWKASDQNLDSANTLLRCAYNFFRESSCVTLPTWVKLYLAPKGVALEPQLKTAIDGGVEVLDVSLPRKLLLWAYTLVHGHWAHISAVLKYCEENIKPKLKKGAVAISSHSSASTPSTAITSAGKDGAVHGGGNEPEPAAVTTASAPGERSSLVSSREGEDRERSSNSGPAHTEV
ncbi:calcineurin-binding protein 1-like isoform X2 [Punica granatum]|uniref:Calcineurin-binding protein 1-like isoform X2 n=1 Tax=Punica granatum TaxID=22663 RepID=A0A6P8CJI1_PUNGR|nr:calcineurin-binding protein 1-like isoform X2 [Punica granatum]